MQREDEVRGEPRSSQVTGDLPGAIQAIQSCAAVLSYTSAPAGYETGKSARAWAGTRVTA